MASCQLGLFLSGNTCRCFMKMMFSALTTAVNLPLPTSKYKQHHLVLRHGSRGFVVASRVRTLFGALCDSGRSFGGAFLEACIARSALGEVVRRVVFGKRVGAVVWGFTPPCR